MLTIHAIFHTEKEAKRAKNALKEADFAEDVINVAVGREGIEEESVDDDQQTVMVTVYADDALGSVAKTILNKANAVKIITSETERPEGVPLYGLVPPQGFPKA